MNDIAPCKRRDVVFGGNFGTGVKSGTKMKIQAGQMKLAGI
jgi:hypothetical protein